MIDKIKKDNERGARASIIEDLFYDFHRSRAQVYWMNFTRGIFFGFGTLIGGTVLVAFTIWILGLFDTLPYIGEYIRNIVSAMK